MILNRNGSIIIFWKRIFSENQFKPLQVYFTWTEHCSLLVLLRKDTVMSIVISNLWHEVAVCPASMLKSSHLNERQFLPCHRAMCSSEGRTLPNTKHCKMLIETSNFVIIFPMFIRQIRKGNELGKASRSLPKLIK